MLPEGRGIKSQINRMRQIPSNHFKNSVRHNARARLRRPLATIKTIVRSINTSPPRYVGWLRSSRPGKNKPRTGLPSFAAAQPRWPARAKDSLCGFALGGQPKSAGHTNSEIGSSTFAACAVIGPIPLKVNRAQVEPVGDELLEFELLTANKCRSALLRGQFGFPEFLAFGFGQRLEESRR